MRRILAISALAVSVSTLISFSAAADESGMATMHDWRRESGRTCMVGHYHYGSGAGVTKQKAIAAAAASWQDFTAFEYGGNWASFKRSASKQITTNQTSTGWTADVSSRPCR